MHVCTSDLFFRLLCRWNETFQKEVLTSRLDTTHLLAKAITQAVRPPQAWILVTGVGMPPSPHESPASYINGARENRTSS